MARCRHEATLVGLPDRWRPERRRRRQGAGAEDLEVGRAGSDLELPVWRRELAGDQESGPACEEAPSVAPWTTRPAVGSPIARSDGVPRRPVSATTTPVVVTRVPIGIERTAPSGIGVAVGTAVGVAVGAGIGVAVGTAVGMGVGAGVGDDPGPGLADGAGVAGGVGFGLGVGTGVGLGTGFVKSSSPARVAWIRYPPVPVPELSRCPSGPTTVAVIPLAIVRPARASGPRTARTWPEPSSSVTAKPSASWSGDPVTTPVAVMREPSSASPTCPVWRRIGAGSPASDDPIRAASAIRSVRCAYRLATSPSTTTRVPAGQDPATSASR